MKACVKIVTTPSGLVTQTITGVTDILGAPFDPLAFFVLGNMTLNTLEYAPGAFVDAFRIAKGWDDGATVRRSNAMADVVAFGAKICTNGKSGQYSFLSEHAQLGFGGFINRRAYISAVRSGEFDITYVQNDLSGDSYAVLVLGGSDLSVAVRDMGSNPLTGLSFAPLGMVMFDAINTATTSTGAGGSANPLSWATKTSGQGVISTFPENQAGNYRGQRTDFCQGGVTNTPAWSGLKSVSAWNSDGVTMSSVFGSGVAALLVGGSAISTAAGTLTQPLVLGQQATPVGFRPGCLVLMSSGMGASTAVLSDQAEQVIGIFDGTNQGSIWVGETTVGNVGSVKGARYLSNATALRFGAANGSSTAFTALAAAVSFTDTGFILDWTLLDGLQREVLWFVIGPGEAIPPVNPNGCPIGVPLAAVTGRAGCVPGIG